MPQWDWPAADAGGRACLSCGLCEWCIERSIAAADGMAMTNDYEKLMVAARHANAEMDAVDLAAGWATPAAGGPRMLLATAMSAIEAGIRTADWACVAEGQVMLQELLAAYKGIGK